MTDPRDTGKPDVRNREGKLDPDGTLREVTCQAVVPREEHNDKLGLTFTVGDGVATLTEVTGSSYSGEQALEALSIRHHVAGILAAELAIEDLEQVRDVRGLEHWIQEEATRAEHGYRFKCTECGVESWGKEAQQAESTPGLAHALSCPECGKTLSSPRDLKSTVEMEMGVTEEDLE